MFAIFSIPFWAYYATTAEEVEQQFEGPQPLHYLISSLVFFLYWTYFESTTGQSIGKKVMNLKTTDINNFLKYDLLTTQFPEQNDSQSVTSSLLKLFNKSNASNNVSIENQIRPILVESFNISTNSNSTDCIGDCRAKWWQSHRSLSPTLKIIGNISSSIDILMLIGENDANTPKCPSYSWLWGK